MPSFTQLFTLATFVAGSLAIAIRQTGGHCPGAVLVSSTTFEVDGAAAVHSTHACDLSAVPRTLPTVINVCSGSCSTSCNNVTGVLPPISEDCAAISNSATILKGILNSPTFTVAPGHLSTLSFGTCSYFFENLSHNTLEYCWDTLSENGDVAGAACFPPHQPFSPQGLCTAGDGSWAVGASHS
ncbi:immunomodulatory protein [Hysterangium stoloniferum]|nr:immunomodulatory protein [Hysterangium stoloniferum]